MEPNLNYIDEDEEYLARRARRKERMLREKRRRQKRRRMIAGLFVFAVVFAPDEGLRHRAVSFALGRKEQARQGLTRDTDDSVLGVR